MSDAPQRVNSLERRHGAAGGSLPETFAYFQAHTYLGAPAEKEIALANRIAGRQPTRFATWARANFPVQ